jgi:hypothetical protein
MYSTFANLRHAFSFFTVSWASRQNHLNFNWFSFNSAQESEVQIKSIEGQQHANCIPLTVKMMEGNEQIVTNQDHTWTLKCDEPKLRAVWLHDGHRTYLSCVIANQQLFDCYRYLFFLRWFQKAVAQFNTVYGDVNNKGAVPRDILSVLNPTIKRKPSSTVNHKCRSSLKQHNVLTKPR